MKLEIWRNRRSRYGRFTAFYASKDGGPVLEGNASLRNFSGFMINFGNHQLIFQFRRVS